MHCKKQHVFVAILREKNFMVNRKSSLASENYHFTSHKPMVTKVKSDTC